MIHLTFICFRCVLTVLYCILKRNFYVIFLFRDIGATGGGRRKEFVVKIHGNLESVLSMVATFYCVCRGICLEIANLL